MAGIITHSASHATFQRLHNAFRSRQLVEASVELLGRTYRTSIREGASAEDLIEKIAKENDGGVARVYYPEFRTWEIVAVKIGDQVLVKGDPAKVADADFSQFSDAGRFRAAALRAASNSEGGIHFSIGKNGIPLAIMDNQEIAFPNAEELRIGKNTNNISLWMTSVNVNPLSLADLSQAYSSCGGLEVSRDALRKIEESHGGTRSDKLLLEDNILVLNKDTGEIFTASQFSAAVPSSLPCASSDFFQNYSIRSDITPAQSQSYDGNPLRNPYFTVKTFDGQLREHLRIQMNAIAESPKLEALPTAPAKNDGEPKSQHLPQLVFSLLRFESKPQDKPPDDFPPPKGGSPSAIRVKAAKVSGRAKRDMPKAASAAPHVLEITPEMIIRKWSEPRNKKIQLGTPVASSPIKLFNEGIPKNTIRQMPLPRQEKKVHNSESPPQKSRSRKKSKPRAAPAVVEPKAKRKNAKERSAAPKFGSMTKPAKPKKEPRALDTKQIHEQKSRKNAGPRTNRAVPEKPKAAAHQKKEILSENKFIANRPEKKKSRKMNRHFLQEMLGLLPQWKKRGRKFSTKKKSAP
jgi:hypothetical protein